MSARVAPEAAAAVRTARELGPESAEHLRIAGLTGVDIELAIAGPGSRSYAFLIDWQLRVLIALGWFFAGWLIEHGPGVGGTRQLFGYTVVLPAVCIYLFYHPVLEVLMHGRTPGKRRAGLRIVTRSGGTPGIGALLMRNVFRLIDSLPGFYLLGLLCCFMSAQRVRIGDLAAGTLLIVDPGTSQAALDSLGGALAGAAAGELSPAAAELVAELLERWGSLQPARRAALARTLLARIDVTAAPALREQWADAQLHARLRELAQPPARAGGAERP
jgi:uncharacterized RDD family membrane protein YckC